MTIHITMAWYVIPAIVTILSLLWAELWPGDQFDSLFRFIVALIISLVAWAVAGALK